MSKSPRLRKDGKPWGRTGRKPKNPPKPRDPDTIAELAPRTPEQRALEERQQARSDKAFIKKIERAWREDMQYAKQAFFSIDKARAVLEEIDAVAFGPAENPNKQRALEWLADQAFGKATAKVEVGDGDGKITVERRLIYAQIAGGLLAPSADEPPITVTQLPETVNGEIVDAAPARGTDAGEIEGGASGHVREIPAVPVEVHQGQVAEDRV